MVVRIDGQTSDLIKFGVGVRQGCPVAPSLFNIYVGVMMEEVWKKVTSGGIKVGGSSVFLRRQISTT